MMDLIGYMETARTELVRDLWEAVQVCMCVRGGGEGNERKICVQEVAQPFL